MPASYTSRQPSYSHRHSTYWALSQKSHIVSSMPCLGTFSTQCSFIHRVRMHGVSNQDTHLYLPHTNSSVHLTTYLRLSGWITDGRQGGWTTLIDCSFIPDTDTHPPGITLLRTAWIWLNCFCTGVRCFHSCLLKWGMTSSAACKCGADEQTINHVVLQSNVQSIDLPMDCTAWQFLTMRHSKGYLTPVS